MVQVAVIVFPGSNCDHDAYYVFKKIIQVPVDFVWHKETNLAKYDLIILPGGFSYGDYLRCGAIARFSPVMKSVVRSAEQGKIIIGICNGFQILTEVGLLPGALLRNRNRKFICRDVYLRVENCSTVFTNQCSLHNVLTIPIAHGEGNYYCDKKVHRQLLDNDQILFRYVSRQGELTEQGNPNGSLDNIAGIINNRRNVLGMMPHPERNSDELIGNKDGIKIFNSIIESIQRKNYA